MVALRFRDRTRARGAHEISVHQRFVSKLRTRSK